MTSQFFGLMKLAYRQCEWDLTKLFGLYLGGWVFAITVAAFSLLNMAFNFYPRIITENPSLAGTPAAALLLSIQFGVINTIYTLTFLFVTIGLFEFAYAFLRVAYEYDDRSWELVQIPGYCMQQIKRGIKYTYGLGAESRVKSKEARAKQREELRKEISELKIAGMLDSVDENTKIE